MQMHSPVVRHETSPPPASQTRFFAYSGPPTLREPTAPLEAWFYLPWDVLQAMLEGLRRPAIVIDVTGRVILQNSAATERVRSYPESMRLYQDENGRPYSPGAFVLNASTSQLGGCSIVLWEPTRVTPDGVSKHCSAQWGLTRRQAEVLALLVQGKCNKAIAETLHCAVRTVELHVSAILDKSGCDARARLVASAWEGATAAAA